LGPPICRGRGYPRYWTCFFKLHLLPTMWPIFVVFRSASSEIRRRKKERKKERERIPGKTQVRRHTMSGDLIIVRKWHSIIPKNNTNKAFEDIRVRPGIATPLVAIRPITVKCDVIHNTGSTYHIATPPEEDRATATRDPHKKIRKDRSSDSRDMLVDTQTHSQACRQTN